MAFIVYEDNRSQYKVFLKDYIAQDKLAPFVKLKFVSSDHKMYESFFNFIIVS